MQTHATMVGAYCRHIDVRCKLQTLSAHTAQQHSYITLGDHYNMHQSDTVSKQNVCYAHLLRGPEVAFGLMNTALEWIGSFLTDRTQQVSYCGRLSPIQPHVLFGVPRGSVLGPLLNVLYIAELELIVARHGRRLHMYADDCQVYLNTSAEDVPLAVSMCRKHQRMAECMQTLAERDKDTAVVSASVSFWTRSTATSWCSAHASPSWKPLATLVLS